MRTLEEKQSAYIIHADLARLFRLLKKVPLDGVKVVRMLKLLMGQWASMYESPLPADLELLTMRLGTLVQRLENGATFKEVTLDKDEKYMYSHLQHIEAEVAAEFTLVQGDRMELVNHKRTTSLHERYASMAAEYEQKMKEAQKRAVEIQCVMDTASQNLAAFDQDLESHGDNVGRLTKLLDELKNHMAQLGEEGTHEGPDSGRCCHHPGVLQLARWRGRLELSGINKHWPVGSLDLRAVTSPWADLTWRKWSSGRSRRMSMRGED